MNNDVLVSAGWVEKLIGAARHHGLRVMSPAMVEGSLGYDFATFAPDAGARMRDAVRRGWCHAVCLAIHKSVWMDIGYFQPVPKLLGYEDTIFFHEMAKARVAAGTTGASWIHHFGSITQAAMKKDRGLRERDGLAYRYNYRLLRTSWLDRKLDKLRRNRQQRVWRDKEIAAHGISMHGLCRGAAIDWI